MNAKDILNKVREHIQAVIKQNSPEGIALWEELVKMHPADLADFFSDLSESDFNQLFMQLKKEKRLRVFEELSDAMKVRALSFMNEPEQVEALQALPSDELTDLLDSFSDEDLNKYLKLLRKQEREEVLSLLKFDPESAGGIMDVDVLSLIDTYTVEQSIKLLQRLRPNREIHRHIYVTDKNNRLVGHINLEDLVLHKPQEHIATFMHKNKLIARVEEDQETVAKNMVHYGLMNVPVVNDEDQLLGVIPSETLVDVIVEEAGEDVQRMHALAPMKHTYFETSFTRLLLERSVILVVLLIAESFAAAIMEVYETTLQVGGLFLYTTMLVSVGGNTSNQTSAIAVQGLAAGEIRQANIMKFLRREMLMSSMMAAILGVAGFVRAYYSSQSIVISSIIALTLAAIVLLSVVLGSCIPFMLKRLKIDPAFSACPFLATFMVIVGVLIYCFISKLLLF